MQNLKLNCMHIINKLYYDFSHAIWNFFKTSILLSLRNLVTSGPSGSFAESVVRDAKENCNKKWPRDLLGARSTRLAPRISRGHFFLAVFFRVTCDRLSEGGYS